MSVSIWWTASMGLGPWVGGKEQVMLQRDTFSTEDQGIIVIFVI